MSTQITYIGHATTHIQNGATSILTDPVFSQKILFLKRETPLPFPVETLPSPTAILISHAHYDHLDIPSFKYFSSKPIIIVPKGLGKFVGKFVKNEIIELDHDATYSLSPETKITAFPVNHTSFRLGIPTQRLCNGYWIETGGQKIFFPGDTGYRSDFAQFKGADVSLLPLSPTAPEWFLRKQRLTPAEALQVFEEMNAKTFIPLHWGTFRLSSEPISTPFDRFKALVSQKGLWDKVKALRPGETFKLNQPALLKALP